MRKMMLLIIAVLALALTGSVSSYARGHGSGSGRGHGSAPGHVSGHGHGSGRVQWSGHGHRGYHSGYYPRFGGGIWIGPGWGWGWPAAPYAPYYRYYPSYTPRVVIEPRQEEYVIQTPGVVEEDYWYYCRKPEGYYPYIKKCPGGWMKVVPPPEAPEEEVTSP